MSNVHGSNVSIARRHALVAALIGLAGFGATAIPGDAHACGGLFCNGPPPNPFAPLPVAQNGENVVFAITPDPAGGAPTLEAHIQILYTGDAAKFSWVVPVDAVPTLGTGTDLLFSSLASVTTPQFIPNYQTSGTCYTPPYDGTMTPGAFGAAGSTGAGGTKGIDGGGGGCGCDLAGATSAPSLLALAGMLTVVVRRRRDPW